MTYFEATLICEGAFEETQEFDCYHELESWAAPVVADCQNKHVDTQVYVVEHDHEQDFDGECCCSQYATDHHPSFSTESEANNA